jgi:hypothetical protein
MAEQPIKTVTVAGNLQGQTVVVNNQRDGMKKYLLFFAGLIIAALAQGVVELWPNMGPAVKFGLDMLTLIGVGGGSVMLTSPLDKRGLIMNDAGRVLVSPTLNRQVNPDAPTPPMGTGTGIGLSMIAIVLGLGICTLFGLTACEYTAKTNGRPVASVSQPVPLFPIATATKCRPVSNYPVTGMRNPGAEPGEEFADSGLTRCGTRWTTDGWITVCSQPNDGDEFDARVRPSTVAATGLPLLPLSERFPGLLGR